MKIEDRKKGRVSVFCPLSVVMKSQCFLTFACGDDFDSGLHCASSTSQVALVSRLPVIFL